jgi:hypothetical protein
LRASVKLLRDAVSKGDKDAPHVKKDADLDPLRPSYRSSSPLFFSFCSPLVQRPLL